MQNITNLYCSCCRDIKRFESDLRTIQRKVQLLKQYNFQTAPNERVYFELKRKLQFDKKHFHFMCGHCKKANINNLSLLEDELNELLVNAAYTINEKDRKYHEVFQLLRGDYPGKHRVMEEFFAKKFRNNTE